MTWRLGSFRAFGVMLPLAVFLLSLAGTSKADALYSTSYINANLERGVTTAYNFDSNCRSNLYDNRVAAYLRDAINGAGGSPSGSASYADTSWMSKAGQPNTVSPTYVTWGTTSVPLQVNSLTFLCGPLVNADTFGSYSYNVAAGSNVLTLYNDSNRWVTAGNATDRYPNQIGSLNQWPARVDTRYQIQGFTVVSGGGSISGGVGSVLRVSRNNSSRYWLATPVGVTYVNPAGIKGDVTLHVRMAYKYITGYHNYPNLSGREERCPDPASSGSIGAYYPDTLAFSQCETKYDDFYLLIKPTYVYDYALTPVVQLTSPSNVVTAGDPVTFSYTVNKTGSNSLDTFIAVKQYVIPPGGSFNEGVGVLDAVNTNCDARYNSGAVCATSTSLSHQTFTSSSTPITDPAIPAVNTAGLATGTRVCRILAVSPAVVNATTQINNRWSAPVCVTIGQKPYVSIMNGDGWAGGSFKAVDATCSIAAPQDGGFTGTYSSYPGPQYYGAFGEYQLFGIGQINGFGSGGRARNAAGTSQAVTLTYRGTPTPYGQFYTKSIAAAPTLTSHCLDDPSAYYSSLPSSPISGTVTPSNFAMPAGQALGVFKAAGPITITGSSFGPSSPTKRIVIVADSSVQIDGNITFGTGLYNTPADIPQFIIMAKGSILISENVTQLDGVYQTYKNFVTCYQSMSGGIGTTGPCKQQLVVNGSVAANKFVLRRTKGGDPANRLIPAEVFNMRSDIFLSEYGRAQANSQVIRTTSIEELPPRY